MATESLTVYPSEFLSSESSTGTQSLPNNPVGKSSSNTSLKAQFRSKGGDYSTVYYAFDLSAIPADATIDSVTLTARGGLTTETSTSSRYLYLCSGTTQKYSKEFSTNGLYTITGTNWTRAELQYFRILWRWYYSKTTAHYLYFYGADLTVTYTYQSEKFMLKLGGSWTDVARVFKKVNGIWVEQTELANVVDQTKRLVNGGEIVIPKPTFTIQGVAYQFEDGMTWAEWVASSYNTGGFVVSGTSIKAPSGLYVYNSASGSNVKTTDSITSGSAYGVG